MTTMTRDAKNPTRTCSVEGCEKPFRARGMCSMHWRRASRDGALDQLPRELSASSTAHRAPSCSVDGCERQHDAKGYCRSHYRRWVVSGDPMGQKAGHGEAMAWLLVALETETDECMIWPFPKDVNGYGHVTANGKTVVVSRFVCELTYGPPGPRQVAAHAPLVCHNPSCFNPRHLRWTSQQENISDQFIDGTWARGSRHGHARLTEADVREIRATPVLRGSQAALARKFGVSHTTINGIVNRQRWTWLP